MTLGQNIKARREGYDITKKELADRVEVSQAMVTYVENNEKIPSLALITRIAKVLHCGIDDLVFGKAAS